MAPEGSATNRTSRCCLHNIVEGGIFRADYVLSLALLGRTAAGGVPRTMAVGTMASWNARPKVDGGCKVEGRYQDCQQTVAGVRANRLCGDEEKGTCIGCAEAVAQCN